MSRNKRCSLWITHTQTHSHKQWCLGLEQWAIRVGKHEVVSNNSNCWGSQIHRPMKMAFPTNVYRKCTVQNVLKLFQKWQQMWKSYIEMARNKCITLTWHWWIEWVNEPESSIVCSRIPYEPAHTRTGQLSCHCHRPSFAIIYGVSHSNGSAARFACPKNVMHVF